MARPASPINWTEVDKLLQAGSDGVEIAAYLGIHPNTFYDRCLADNKVGFTEYSQEKKSCGKAILRAAQFKKAVSGKGDSGMLKWLGIHMLGQKETNLTDIEEASKQGTINAVREIQEQNRARARDASGSDLETEQSLLDQGCPGEQSEVSDELGAEGTL